MSAAPTMETLSITRYQHKRDNRPRAIVLSWEGLVETLRTATPSPCTVADCPGKECPHKDGVLWSPASYPPSTTRANANVLALSCTVLDVDDIDGVHYAELLGRVRRYRHIIHGTHRDRHRDTPDLRRLRVVLAQSRPVTCDEWPTYWRGVVALLELPGVDGQRKDPAGMYYRPSIPRDADYTFVEANGCEIDVDAVIASVPVEAPRSSSPSGTRSTTADRELLLRRARAYVGRVPGAVQHQGGSAVTFELAAWLVHGFGLDDGDALAVLAEWNQRCDPPWDTETEHGPDSLRRKITEARTKADPSRFVIEDREPRQKRTDRDEAHVRDDESAPDDDRDAPPPGDEDAPDDESPGGVRRPSLATLLVDLARRELELWHAEGQAFASIAVDGHREHVRIGARATELPRWLAALAWRHLRRAVGRSSLVDACGVLAGLALHEGAAHRVATRIAEHEGRVYLDLCDEQWRAVEIDVEGWRIVDVPPVRFARRAAMAALPTPVAGGRLDELREHVRITDDSWPLVAGWLVGALAPRGPYPVLVYRGRHGAGKSHAARCLRSLVDPSIAPIRSEPREPRDLVISAQASHVLALDNLSSIPPWLSDGLCRLATGGGYAARALYTDDDEIVIDVQRPTILTGITDVVTAPDLLDRSLLVELDAIAPADRRTERDLLARYTTAQPRLLGALCSAVSVALRRRDTIRLAELPRLADWATWASAAEPALGLSDGAVIAALADQREEVTEIALEASAIARPLRELVAARVDGTWTGTAADLLAALAAHVEPQATRDRSWPQTPRGLAGQLARLVSTLAETGVEVERMPRRRDGSRTWRISVGSSQRGPLG